MATQKIETGLIADSAVTTAKLADNSVTAAKIAAGSLDDQVKGISSSADAVAITIDSSENVGIGASSPTFAGGSGLEIERAGIATLRLQDTTNVANAELQSGESGLHVRVGANGSSGNLFNVSSAGTSRLLIDSSGSVGIGTDSPDTLLHLNAVQAGSVLRLSRQDGSVVANDSLGKIEFYTTDVTNTGVAGYIDVQAEGGAASGSMIFGTGTAGSASEQVRIASNGNVGIGNTSPLGKLTISNAAGTNAPTTVTAANTYLQLGSDDYGASSNGKFMIGFGYTDATNTNSPAYIGFEETSSSGDTKGALTFYTRDVITDTAPTEAMRISSNGQILLTAAHPSIQFTDSSDNSDAYIQADGGTLRFFADDNNEVGSSYQSFHIDGSEKVRITSSGGLEVGDGTNYGYLKVINDDAIVGYFDRRNGSGTILQFREDDSPIGSLNIQSSTLQIGTSNTQLAFSDADDAFFVKNEAGANRDGSHDLGKSSARFKDIYLSGNVRVDAGQGIFFSGAAGASGMTSQLLDDYEEGTWTPTLEFGNSSTGITYTTQAGFYTKIGRLVTFSFRIDLSSKGSATGNAAIDGLPFTALSTAASNTGAYPTFITAGASNVWQNQQTMTIDNNTTLVRFRYVSGTNYADHNEGTFANNTIIIAAGQYYTA